MTDTVEAGSCFLLFPQLCTLTQPPGGSQAKANVTRCSRSGAQQEEVVHRLPRVASHRWTGASHTDTCVGKGPIFGLVPQSTYSGCGFLQMATQRCVAKPGRTKPLGQEPRLETREAAQTLGGHLRPTKLLPNRVPALPLGGPAKGIKYREPSRGGKGQEGWRQPASLASGRGTVAIGPERRSRERSP